MSEGVSINDIINSNLRTQRERVQSIHELAYSEPDVSGISAHVLAAHQDQLARATAPQPQPIVAEITFRPDIGAFEMVTENRDAMSLLRALGPQAKITIHF